MLQARMDDLVRPALSFRRGWWIWRFPKIEIPSGN